MHRTRPAFTHSALLSKIRTEFDAAAPDIEKSNGISLSDCLMSGLAIFSLKYKSLLKFEEDKTSEHFIKANLKNLYGVTKAPCDTYLRERLDDEGLITQIRKSFASLFGVLQRSRVLYDWNFLDNKFLISLDGSGFFSSNKVHCKLGVSCDMGNA